MISSDGRVKNSKTGRILKTYKCNTGYKRVKINKDTHRASFYIHRLVAEYFLDNPNGKPEVNHKDRDKNNNSINNLEWVTRAENMNHAFKDAGVSKRRGGYVAYINKDNKRYFLGDFKDKTHAKDAYNFKFNELYGYYPRGV